MDQHDDLLEAALNAIDAIEANSPNKADTSEEPQKPVIAPPVPQNKLNSEQYSLSSNLLDEDEDEDDEEEGFEIDLSLSSLGFADSEDEVETGQTESPSLSGLKCPDDGDDIEAAEATEDCESEDCEALSTDAPSQYEILMQQYQALSAQLEEMTAKYDEIKAENDQLHIIQKQFNDKLIRVTADFDNYRKRVARDQELMRNQAEERIITGFLPVMDNLERALVHAKQQNDYDQLLKGVEMTGKLYLGALAKHGCVPFGSLGETFDPVYHDVLSRVIDPEKPHNSIVQEHLRGYMMHDRVLRPALVVVSQHEEEPQGE